MNHENKFYTSFCIQNKKRCYWIQYSHNVTKNSSWEAEMSWIVSKHDPKWVKFIHFNNNQVSGDDLTFILSSVISLIRFQITSLYLSRLFELFYYKSNPYQVLTKLMKSGENRVLSLSKLGASPFTTCVNCSNTLVHFGYGKRPVATSICTRKTGALIAENRQHGET